MAERFRLLTFQVVYACRHTGACCNAGWVEPQPDGRCRFYTPHPEGGCDIQRVHGETALPQACRQFPRVVTHSPLGISLTLSAFCPTAAGLLFDTAPFAVTTGMTGRLLEGLDARQVLPPLLRPGMLMDWEAVARWEELAVTTLSTHRANDGHALTVIERASASVCERWTPADGPLADALTAAYETADSLAPPGPDLALAAARARFLAGHAFACWDMYNGGGIRGALAHLRHAADVLHEESARLALQAGRALDAALLKEACRQADLRLRHAN